MQDLLNVILPVFIVIGAGYLAVWKGPFTDGGVDGLMSFTQTFAIPCLLFRAIADLDLKAGFDLAMLGSFYLGATVCFCLGIFGARILFKRPWEDSVAIGFVCLFSNSVLIGLPITERAYGADALTGNFAIVALHAPFCYGLGVTVMEVVKNKGGGALRTLGNVARSMARNALVIGIVLGFVVNITGIMVPGVLMTAVDMLVMAALPAALFGLGGVLYRYRPEGDAFTIAFICAVSLIIHPVIVLSAGSVTGLSTEAFRSAVLTSAMAPGINTYLFANMYGVAKRVAASSVLIGTATSILTVWMWLLILP